MSNAEDDRHQDEYGHHARDDPGGGVAFYEQDDPDHPEDGPDAKAVKPLSPVGIELSGLGQCSGMTPELQPL